MFVYLFTRIYTIFYQPYILSIHPHHYHPKIITKFQHKDHCKHISKSSKPHKNKTLRPHNTNILSILSYHNLSDKNIYLQNITILPKMYVEFSTHNYLSLYKPQSFIHLTPIKTQKL